MSYTEPSLSSVMFESRPVGREPMDLALVMSPGPVLEQPPPSLALAVFTR